ncbi:MAG: PAS domain S-box protein [Chlorobi bacterium]|nr:PAS domain S-box protein [Chlorobiota bacterium]
MANNSVFHNIRIKQHYIIFIISWTIINIIIFVSGFLLIKNKTNDILEVHKQTVLNTFSDIYFSGFVQNGIYTKINSKIKANPFLKSVKERDIVLDNKDTLTLLSPRQIIEQFFNKLHKNNQIKIRMFGENPLNTENTPTKTEIGILNGLKNDTTTISHSFTENGKDYYQLIKPLKKQESCSKCHTNFNSDNYLGAISFTFPIDIINKKQQGLLHIFSIIIFIIWLIGVLFLLLSLSKINKALAGNKLIVEKLKKSESKYRIIVNNMSDVIWKMDTQMRFTYISPSIEKLTGYTPEEYMQTPLNVSHTAKSYDNILTLFKKGLKDLEEGNIEALKHIKPIEEELIHKNKNIIYTEFTTSLTFDNNAKINGIQGVTRDITKRKIISNKLYESEKELKKLIATKDKFFSIIAHDLKNPFNALIGFSNLLVENYNEYDDEKKLEFIDLIEKSAVQGYELLQNLLEWARTQTGRIEFNPENVNLNEAINECIDLVSLAKKSKRIEIVNHTSIITMVFADRYMLKSILYNLINNAIKFSEKESQIDIYSEEKNNFIQITVKDTGIGISKENLAKLFKLDESFSTKGTNSEKGTGLGLIICKEFVKRHKGEISVTSELNKGSEFIITLPGARL